MYFKYKKQVYKQKFGLGMELSLAGTLSDFLHTDLFDNKLPTLSFQPAFLKKFVDDILTMDKLHLPKTYFVMVE